MPSMAAARRCALPGMQCLCGRIRPSLCMDGNLYRKEELPTVREVQYDGKRGVVLELFFNVAVDIVVTVDINVVLTRLLFSLCVCVLSF